MIDEPPLDTADWRPQAFGGERVQSIEDPLIEPLWPGLRALAIVAGRSVELRDPEGEPIEGLADLAGALADAALAEALVLDGYLSEQPLRDPRDVYAPDVRVPTAGEMTAQMVLGRDPLRQRADLRPGGSAAGGIAAERLAFVAIDLLAIDNESLLDIPLLERKRILESAIAESELVRIGPYVRPPVEPWLGSWRSVGFTAVAYKAANSRYEPGRPNRAWAIAEIPKR